MTIPPQYETPVKLTELQLLFRRPVVILCLENETRAFEVIESRPGMPHTFVAFEIVDPWINPRRQDIYLVFQDEWASSETRAMKVLELKRGQVPCSHDDPEVRQSFDYHEIVNYALDLMGGTPDEQHFRWAIIGLASAKLINWKLLREELLELLDEPFGDNERPLKESLPAGMENDIVALPAIVNISATDEDTFAGVLVRMMMAIYRPSA